jgi:uncharacterized protein DUF3667
MSQASVTETPVAVTEPVSTTCYNCGAPLDGPFCARCGQKAAPLNPTLSDFLHDFTHEMLHVDGRIFRSVRKLLLSPGFLTREQFEGHRASWIAPIRLYLIFSIAYFALTSLAAARAVPPAGGAESDPDTIFGLQLLGFESEQALDEAIAEARAHWMPRVMFLLVPLYAWLVGRASRRLGRNYPQHLYFALHVHAAWFAAAALVAAARFAAPSLVPGSLDALPLVYGFVYAVMAFRLAYGVTIRQSAMRMTAVAGIYYVVIVIASLGIATAVVVGRA